MSRTQISFVLQIASIAGLFAAGERARRRTISITTGPRPRGPLCLPGRGGGPAVNLQLQIETPGAPRPLPLGAAREGFLSPPPAFLTAPASPRIGEAAVGPGQPRNDPRALKIRRRGGPTAPRGKERRGRRKMRGWVAGSWGPPAPPLPPDPSSAQAPAEPGAASAAGCARFWKRSSGKSKRKTSQRTPNRRVAQVWPRHTLFPSPSE